ncbi:MAG: shikimate kinase, partial [Bacteroidales bacterium]|nr:shikimate kinase [Bacteroidales bacterium]
MRIFLVGFMFSGKSTVGKLLAKSMGYEHIDTDHMFESLYNISINDFFEKYGQDLFRELEHKLLLTLIEKDNIVISTGGGLPCFHNNMELIKQNGISIHINMSFKSIIHRQKKSKKNRPLLKNKSQEEIEIFLQDLLAKRIDIYNQSNIIIKGEDLSIKEL